MAATTQQQRPPTSLLDHTLRTAPLNIVYGTAASSSVPSLSLSQRAPLTTD